MRIRSDWVSRVVADGVFLPEALVASRVDLKQTSSRQVECVTLAAGCGVILKRYPPRSGPEGWITGWPRRLATDHEWAHGRALEAAGLPVATPIAVGWQRRGLRREGVLVTQEIPGSEDLLEVMEQRGLRGAERHAITRELGRLIRRIHDAGFIHHDPHLGNFMLAAAGDPDGARLHLIDLRRIERREHLDEEERRRSLVRLYESFGVLGSAADRHRFLTAYLHDAARDARRRWARSIEARSLAFLAHFRWRRSRAALKTNRGFRCFRRGSVSWHHRRVETDPRLDAVLEDPDAFVEGASERLKEGRSARVVAEGDWVVKRDNVKRLRRRLRERWVAGRTLRALRFSWYLEMVGIATPRVALAGERQARGQVLAGFLVMKRVPGARRVHDALRAAPRGERQALLRRIARLVADLHRSHLKHRDLKAGNLLHDATGALQLVDLDGLAFVRRPDPRRQERDLERLLRDLRRRGELTAEEERGFRDDYAQWRRRGLPRSGA